MNRNLDTGLGKRKEQSLHRKAQAGDCLANGDPWKSDSDMDYSGGGRGEDTPSTAFLPLLPAHGRKGLGTRMWKEERGPADSLKPKCCLQRDTGI